LTSHPTGYRATGVPAAPPGAPAREDPEPMPHPRKETLMGLGDKIGNAGEDAAGEKFKDAVRDTVD
jgi:hypothetical protein